MWDDADLFVNRPHFTINQCEQTLLGSLSICKIYSPPNGMTLKWHDIDRTIIYQSSVMMTRDGGIMEKWKGRLGEMSFYQL